MAENPPLRQVRAVFDDETITVYQAYSAQIAVPAVRAGRFVDPFKTSRMTWIKPSFLWMMYRSGWGTKPGQEHVLAIRITRSGFEQALAHAALAHFDPPYDTDPDAWRRSVEASFARVQWDPERTPDGEPLPWRSLQVGLGPALVPSYVNNWIVDITDLTPQLPALRSGQLQIPQEHPYRLRRSIAEQIHASEPFAAP